MSTWYIRQDFKTPVDLNWQIIRLHTLLVENADLYVQNGELHVRGHHPTPAHVYFADVISTSRWISLILLRPFQICSPAQLTLSMKTRILIFSKLPIIEDVCLRVPSAPFHVILQKCYTNDMAVCNISPASSGINLMQLLYNQTGDWSVWETLLGILASLTQCEFQALMANTVMLLLLFKVVKKIKKTPDIINI